MAWRDYDNAVPAELGGDAGVRFNAATGRNYLAVYEFNADGVPTTVTGYISFEPHANRSNEGAFVRHDPNGYVTGYGNFDPRSKSFRNFLLAAGALAGAGLAITAAGGAAGAGAATGGVTGSTVGGSGAFLGEGVVSGVTSWDAAATAAASATSSAASTVGATLKSALSSASTFLKPALSLASALTGGTTTDKPTYVPFDQPAAASTVHPLVWVGLAAGAAYLLLEK